MPTPRMNDEEQQAYDEALRRIKECGPQGKELRLSTLGLTALPPEIGQLSALTTLDLSSNQFTALPPEIGQLSALTHLYLHSNQLTALPPEIGKLSALNELDLSHNHLTALPPEIGQLSALKELYLYNNQLSALPPEIGQLSALTGLSLSNNQLTSLPPEIGQLSALTRLFLDENQLTSLPPEIARLTKLKHLFLHENPGLGLPPEVLGPPVVEVLGGKNAEPADPKTILNYYFAQHPSRSSISADPVSSAAKPTTKTKPTSKPSSSSEPARSPPEEAPVDEGPLQGRTQFASDAHSMEDHLGRKAHVVAMAHFIKHPGTSTPLTVSIEGPWGSGKTSFMRQVEDELKKNGPEQPVTVWFNPWRHADGAALWAAFALELARSLRDGADFTTRWLWAPLSLWLDRPRKNATASDKTSYAMRWMLLVSVAVGLLVFLCGSLWLNHCFLIHDQKSLGTAWQTIDAWSSKGRTALALLSTASVVGVARQMWSFRETPLAAKITRLLKMETAAGEKLSETERFHDDFARMVKAYAGGRRLYVFVDDLDRCDVPKAADLMQAINLMLSGDDMNAIFILGMDREKVAAGIAVKHKDLLPYLYSRERAAEVKTTADANTVPKPEDAMHVRGLEYGYSFIEKFIQLPFRLPAAGDEGMRTYLHHLTGVSLSGKGWRSILSETRRAAEKQRKRAAAPNHPPNTHDSPRGPEESLETLTERERVMLKMDTLSERGKKIVKSHDEQQFTIRLVQNAVTLTTDEALHDAMEMILPFMENNPRRLKQALNMLRLWSYLAAEWLHSDDLTPTDKQLKEGPWLTHKKLAKVIVMELRWPTKLLDVAEKIGTNSVGQNDNRRWQNLNYLPHNIDPNRKSNSTSRDLNWHGIDKALWNAGGESAILRVIDLQAILSVAIPANRRDSEMQEKAPESDGEAAE